MDEENKTTEPEILLSAAESAPATEASNITEPIPQPTPDIITEVKPLQNTVTITEIMEPPVSKQKTLWKSFLEKVSFNKKKKLDRIMAFVTERGKISNDDVEKLLRVSDRTARRYLDLLEKQGNLKQVGNIGKYVYYTKI